MVLLTRDMDTEDAMPQTVPSAGFTPPCDYSNFADNFDLSLLPGGDQPLSPSTLLYAQSPPPYDSKKTIEPKIITTFYESDDNEEFRPDFQKLLDDQENSNIFPQSPLSNIYLEVPTGSQRSSGSLSPYSSIGGLSPNNQFGSYRQSETFYPSSPELSLYPSSPNSVYSRSSCDEYLQGGYIKTEAPLTPLPSFSPFQIKDENYLSPCEFSSPASPASTCYSTLSSPATDASVGDKQIKQESTVDFGSILDGFQDNSTLRALLNTKPKIEIEEKPKDHQLLREVLEDTSFQKKFNIKPIDFGFIKMEEPDEALQDDLIRSCDDQIEPVLNMAIEQMRQDVTTTCSALGISQDPLTWTSENVFSWVQWTSREFNLPEPESEQWKITGSELTDLSEQAFLQRSPEGGMILHAQLEIWKAAFMSDDMTMQWLPETTSSNASSGNVSEDEDEETLSPVDPAKPTTSRSGGSHIHLWQFLKELLSNAQAHSSCIRWLDRTKGIFKIEDSVKVARLWGKRKNRPAMNYDKLSRSIRQYYKKGIMKKTERSQRLVYQFCHPYNL